jgi:hypothetical protein
MLIIKETTYFGVEDVAIPVESNVIRRLMMPIRAPWVSYIQEVDCVMGRLRGLARPNFATVIGNGSLRRGGCW